MAPRIFITGVTGYIAGTVLDVMYRKYPQFAYTVMMRSALPDFRARYPALTVVIGDYDKVELLEACAAEADIVIHAGNSDHMPAVQGLLKGCLRRDPNPSYLIHLSGAATISDSPDHPAGRLNPRTWSDMGDISSIQNLPDETVHRPVDKLLQDFANRHGDAVKISIVCPPEIYGAGTGVGKQTSYMVPMFAEECRKLGYAFYVEAGENVRSVVHIKDVAALYMLLVEDALDGGKRADWGANAYFFCSSAEFVWKDLASAVGKILFSKHLIGEAEPRSVALKDTADMMNYLPHPIGQYLVHHMFGLNSRSRADRALTLLGWEPTHPSLWAELDLDVEMGLRDGCWNKSFPAGPKS